MKRLKLLAFLMITILFLAGCEKEIPAGQQIQASGIVYDSVKNKKLPNATVYLYGVHTGFMSNHTIGPLDSAITDNAGNFTIKYTAEGKSMDYSLAVINTSSYIVNSVQTNYVSDNTHSWFSFHHSYTRTSVVVFARELNYARISLKVFSNPYDTLYLDGTTDYGDYWLRHSFTGKNVDTSFLTRYLPGKSNTFTFQILSTFLMDSGWYIRRQTDTIPPKLDDTITLSKTFNSTYDIPIRLY